MTYYDSFGIYITSKRTSRERIVAIDAVIDALINTSLDAAGSANMMEYDLDDGQSKIKTMYRSPDEITKAIFAFEKLKEMYINKLNKRTFRMVDEKQMMRITRYGYGSW